MVVPYRRLLQLLVKAQLGLQRTVVRYRRSRVVCHESGEPGEHI